MTKIQYKFMYYVTKKIILLRWQKEKHEFVSCVMMV